MTEPAYDVVVVGGGNAGLAAALEAADSGARVLVLERAPERLRGGNSYFTGGLVRLPYGSLDDLRPLVPDLTPQEEATIDLGPYTAKDFFDDMARTSEYRADGDLLSLVTDEAYDAMMWMRSKGLRFTIAFGRGSQRSGNEYHFFPGTPIEYAGGGPGLIEGLFKAIDREPRIETWYRAHAISLVADGAGISGVRVRRSGTISIVTARSVVLACGGFQANPELRARYLGPNWDLAKVRGTEFNTGEGIMMALAVGAQPYGHWSGCHAVAWDANAPSTGDRAIGDAFQKHSYPYGIVVNRGGHRFLDEGADFVWYTYAKYGQEILKQPGLLAFQIFDAKVMHLLRDDYRIRQATKQFADSLTVLAERLEIDPAELNRTVEAFNSATDTGPIDPSRLDGRGTIGIVPPKSNWAMPIDTPPFVGYPVTAGITFTFGGLRINREASVLDDDNVAIPGLFAAGELVGGLFYHNYAGGTGLTTGTVFGRRAGRGAARRP